MIANISIWTFLRNDWCFLIALLALRDEENGKIFAIRHTNISTIDRFYVVKKTVLMGLRNCAVVP